MTPVGRMPAMSLAVVGVDYPNKDGSDRRFEILLCGIGEPVELRPEPKNKHDKYATAVISCRGVQIGYVTAERAPRISQLIRDGRELRAVFQVQSQFGAWIRVAFDGEVPELTDAMLGEDGRVAGEFVDAEPDFYPDEVWPEDGM